MILLKSLKDIRAILPSYLQMDGSIGNEGRKIKMPVVNLIYNIVMNDKDPHLLAEFLINKK